MNIDIDYLPGCHGQYLMFVLNKLLLGDKLLLTDPFTSVGNSHKIHDSSVYLISPPVESYHYYAPSALPALSEFRKNNQLRKEIGNNIIRITIENDDFLTYFKLATCRGGNRNFDPKVLEDNLYYKLIDTVHPLLSWQNLDLIKRINKRYETVILDFYNLLRDEIKPWDQSKEIQEKWPAITKPSDFLNLSEEVQQEYRNKFGEPFFNFGEENPNCPRHLLRNYFKDGFSSVLAGESSAYTDMLEYSKLREYKDKNVYNFAFRSFYNKANFLIEIKKIKEFFNLEFVDFDLENLHDKFLAKQPQKNLRQKMDIIIRHISNKKPLDLTELTVIEEAYINAKVEQIYDVKLSLVDTIKFPKSVNELVKQYGLNK